MTSHRRIFGFTWIEWITVVAVVTLLIAFLAPAIKSVWSGSRVVPVVVQIFDATSGAPIEGAHVTLFRGWSPSLNDAPSKMAVPSPEVEGERLKRGTTGADGRTRIDVKFDAGGGSTTGKTWVHLSVWWMSVKTERYGAVVLPIRYEAEELTEEKKHDGVFVIAGLFPREMR